jgi:hypothetical protein
LPRVKPHRRPTFRSGHLSRFSSKKDEPGAN